MVSETKIDETLPLAQLCVEGCSTSYRLDRTCKGGGLLLYVRDDIPSKQIKLKFIENEAFQGFFVEINPRQKKKAFLCCSYNQDKNKILSRLHVISKALDDLSKKYDNFILSGDLNSEPEEKNVKFSKHLPFEKYCQTKHLFQKPRQTDLYRSNSD